MRPPLARGFFTLWIALVASCGSGSSDGTDMGGASCDGGVTPFALASGTYQTTSVTGLMETCGMGVTAQDLMVARMVTRDALTGIVTVASQDGMFVLFSAVVPCNVATLKSGPVTEVRGSCQYAATRSLQVNVTGANRLTIVFSEERRDHMSVAGMMCIQGSPCAVAYTIELKM